jgi:potassium voltage-gated channel Eag-related subfamily H protein 7
MLDCVSSIPIKTITIFVPGMGQLAFLRVFKLFKLFRLVKLLKLKALEDLEDSGVLSPSTLRLSKISFSFVFLVHIVACGYWLQVEASCIFCEEKTWSGEGTHAADCSNALHYGAPSFTTPKFCPNVYKVTSEGSSPAYMLAESGHHATLTDKYLFAFYWAIMAMLGDNADPETNGQLTFSIVMSMVGIVVFSTVIGSLSAVLSSLDSAAAAKQDQLDSVNAFLTFRKVNPDLKLRIRAVSVANGSV